MLDPIHFGGQNTTHEGFSDCVARDHDEYASIAVRLGTDPAYRKHIVEKIEKTRDKVWQEDSVARQFEDFFISALETKCS